MASSAQKPSGTSESSTAEAEGRAQARAAQARVQQKKRRKRCIMLLRHSISTEIYPDYNRFFISRQTTPVEIIETDRLGRTEWEPMGENLLQSLRSSKSYSLPWTGHTAGSFILRTAIDEISHSPFTAYIFCENVRHTYGFNPAI